MFCRSNFRSILVLELFRLFCNHPKSIAILVSDKLDDSPNCVFPALKRLFFISSYNHNLGVKNKDMLFSPSDLYKKVSLEK